MKNLSHKLFYLFIFTLCVSVLIFTIFVAEGKTYWLSVIFMILILAYPIIFSTFAFCALCFGKKVYAKFVGRKTSGNVMTSNYSDVGYTNHVYFKYLTKNGKIKTASTIFSVDISKGIIVLRRFGFVYIVDKYSTANLNPEIEVECINQIKKLEK